jgi:hypothetical protein
MVHFVGVLETPPRRRGKSKWIGRNYSGFLPPPFLTASALDAVDVGGATAHRAGPPTRECYEKDRAATQFLSR